MVRADLLDAVDDVLRRFRDHRRPFGGVQLLMIGDLHQLPPVVKQEDWEVLTRFYDTPYFFGSSALQQTEYISIELKHIYRQSDPEFIALLNKVRDNCLDEQSLRKLNSRFVPDFRPPSKDAYITLTATNAAAAPKSTPGTSTSLRLAGTSSRHTWRASFRRVPIRPTRSWNSRTALGDLHAERPATRAALFQRQDRPHHTHRRRSDLRALPRAIRTTLPSPPPNGKT